MTRKAGLGKYFLAGKEEFYCFSLVVSVEETRVGIYY